MSSMHTESVVRLMCQLAPAVGIAIAAATAGAESIPFQAEGSLVIANPPGLANPPTIEFQIEPVSGTASVVPNGGPAAFTLPAGLLIGGGEIRNIPEGGGQPLASVSFRGSNALGSFSPGEGGSGGFGGAMRFLGEVIADYRIGLATGRQVVDINALGTSTTVMQVEQLTFATGMGLSFSVPATVTARGARWTTGMLTVTAMNNDPTGGQFTGSIMATGFDNRTPGGGGEIQLVTPLLIQSAITQNQPGVATLHVVFAPEPGPVALTLVGIAVLGLAVRAKR